MDYDRILSDNPDKDFFYNREGYPTEKLVVGHISYENALVRLAKGEYYVLVKTNGQELPMGYIPVDAETLKSAGFEGNETMATVNPRKNFYSLCQNGGIQLVSKLPSPENDTEYLLGPGPETVNLSDLVREQLQDYKNSKSTSHVR